MSKLSKIVLVLISTPIILSILFVARYILDFTFFYPNQYARLQTEAKMWNQEYWETGYASRVTVQVTSDEMLGGNTATVVMNCYGKRFATAHSANGPPSSGITTMSDGPDNLGIPFGPEAMHITSLRSVCWDILMHGDEWPLPHVTQDDYHWSDIVAKDQSLVCYLGDKSKTSRGEVSRLTFVSIEQVPLRETISNEEYSSLRKQNASYPPQTRKHYWEARAPETQCWRIGGTGACAPRAETICGTPLN
ncbi:hypothetical protein [Algicella marina]|uniref:Uncharacterized protein n=1 Tax=Algicella marina TaxID=2683284 RepID=A0A6P1T186_9RHOB|nr:hypothetical protein [Algicella marina]QHQ35403.1 hypothetical protein GO499_09445 [Algicella marina]